MLPSSGKTRIFQAMNWTPTWQIQLARGVGGTSSKMWKKSFSRIELPKRWKIPKLMDNNFSTCSLCSTNLRGGLRISWKLSISKVKQSRIEFIYAGDFNTRSKNIVAALVVSLPIWNICIYLVPKLKFARYFARIVFFVDLKNQGCTAYFILQAQYICAASSKNIYEKTERRTRRSWGAIELEQELEKKKSWKPSSFHGKYPCEKLWPKIIHSFLPDTISLPGIISQMMMTAENFERLPRFPLIC